MGMYPICLAGVNPRTKNLFFVLGVARIVSSGIEEQAAYSLHPCPRGKRFLKFFLGGRDWVMGLGVESVVFVGFLWDFSSGWVMSEVD